jgi:hypothetical protein
LPAQRPLYAELARENFPLKMMGTVIGGTAMASSLGMATGSIAGVALYRRVGYGPRCVPDCLELSAVSEGEG